MNSSFRAQAPRLLIVLVTILLTWGALMVGTTSGAVEVVAGEPSPQDFSAPFAVRVEDREATAEARDAASATVQSVYTRSTDIEDTVVAEITGLFNEVRAGVVAARPGAVPVPVTVPAPVDTVPAPVDTVPPTTLAEGEEPTTATITEATTVTGVVFIDLDGDGRLNPDIDAGMARVEVVIGGLGEELLTAMTDEAGSFTASGVGAGIVQVGVDLNQSRLEAFDIAEAERLREADVDPGGVVELAPIPVVPRIITADEQSAALTEAHPSLRTSTVDVLVNLAIGDIVRGVQGGALHLGALEQKAVDEAEQRMNGEIRSEDIDDERDNLYARPPSTFVDGELDVAAGNAVADVVALFLQANMTFDEAQTVAARLTARDSVDPVMVDYPRGSIVVRELDPVSQVQRDALDQLGLLRPSGPERLALLAIVAVATSVLAFYLARFRPGFWVSKRRVALFGLLLVLAALASQAVALVGVNTSEGILARASIYLIPAAAFGFTAAILFDARIGVVMSVAMAALSVVATRDPAAAVFALLSAMAPIPFVSAISTRGDIRRAVVLTGGVVILIAAPVAWYFQGAAVVADAVMAAAVNGLLLTGLLGMAALPFLEATFDVTTSLRLLDLTDRNHAALRKLQDEAWGTFNHSLMVGTLADRAARSIGANNLLALAAAYYHDLGKTANPTFFIENQNGISNPHDQLPPEESASIIRQHVTDGMRLAREYHIPSEVAEGILTHHGDGVMRYFYEKARERSDDVAIEDFRHEGHKPLSREMAIVMMADSLESACRAVFASQDPSPERIWDVVERIVGEKVADGQLSLSALTLGDLTAVKRSFVEALVGHYHQRIPYPNFPTVEELGGQTPRSIEGGSDPGESDEDDSESDHAGAVVGDESV